MLQIDPPTFPMDSHKVQEIRRTSADIIQSCPYVTQLIIAGQYAATAEQILAELTPKLLEIRTIESIRFQPTLETWRDLGALPSLTELCYPVITRGTATALTASHDPNGFPRLRQLRMGSDSWESALRLTQCMPCRFEGLDITLELDRSNTAGFKQGPTLQPNLGDLTNSFLAHPFIRRTLTSLSLSDELEESETLPISFFQPLLSLTALQNVTLNLHGMEQLDDDWLRDAALAWPDLRDLSIPVLDTQFTLKGLIPLVKHCHRLTKLDVCPMLETFDTSILPSDGSASNEIINEIGLRYDSEMVPKEDFACLIAMFSNLVGVSKFQRPYVHGTRARDAVRRGALE